MSYIAFVPGRDVCLFVAVDRVDFTMFFGLSTPRQRAVREPRAALTLLWSFQGKVRTRHLRSPRHERGLTVGTGVPCAPRIRAGRSRHVRSAR